MHLARLVVPFSICNFATKRGGSFFLLGTPVDVGNAPVFHGLGYLHVACNGLDWIQCVRMSRVAWVGEVMFEALMMVGLADGDAGALLVGFSG